MTLRTWLFACIVAAAACSGCTEEGSNSNAGDSVAAEEPAAES